MPVIRISDPTWDRLKRWAVPLEDGPDDAVRKALDMADEHLKCLGSTQPSMAQRPGVPRPADIDQQMVDSTIDRARQGSAEIPTSGGRLPPGIRLPISEYEMPILETVREMGGKASTARVLVGVEAKLRGRLPPEDYQFLPGGSDIRWRNRAQSEIYYLRKRGLLNPEAGRGILELTELGMKAVESKDA